MRRVKKFHDYSRYIKVGVSVIPDERKRREGETEEEYKKRFLAFYFKRNEVK